MWDQRETSSLGARSWFPIKGHKSIFEVFCRHWNPCRWQKLMINDGILPTSRQTPDQLDLKIEDADCFLPHHPPIRRMSTSWQHPLWKITIKLLTILSKWTHGFSRQDPAVSPFAWQSNKAILFLCVLSHFSHVQLFVTLWTIARQAPLSVGFSRQGYLSGLPFPTLVFPTRDWTHVSCIYPALAGRFFTTGTTF